MPLKRNKERGEWIAASSEIKKIKSQWLQSSETNVPMLIVGERGTGKSYWIEESILHRKISQDRVLRIDYANRPVSIEILKRKIQSRKIEVIWWENVFSAEKSFILELLQWWKEEKYSEETDYFLYWEIGTEELENEQSEFAKDLFDQLKPFQFKLPSFKERKSEIPYFVQCFLEEANASLKKKISTFDEGFFSFFAKKVFKNNLQELKDLIHSIVAFTSSKKVIFKNLPIHFLENDSDSLGIRPGINMEVYEKEIIKANLIYTKGNREKTAKLLGISERNLYRKIGEYQLEDVP
ncbi:helix-turn-helix domain-containing protein [Leptospira idonii]|uniref:Transcriptional regulator n=1 Tax=Leptospira idonii TaxID=1193500 RepID=A0A4R9M0W9_9LEPT|nr:helix-turn-helix domain-containing protein [Leptospira idonii]TGN20330.1 transcriptional regulator [Leptospira idonii]